MSRPQKIQFMLSEVQLRHLYQYALTLCSNSADAYDLLQGSVEKYLIEVKCRSRKISQPEAFVRTLIRNRFIDQFRYQKRWPTTEYQESSAIDISEASLEKLVIDQDTLKKIWEQLSPQDRDILYHWAVLGHSTDESCQLLDMSRGTFLSRIHRLRLKLAGERFFSRVLSISQGTSKE